jgi:hypothetical protein
MSHADVDILVLLILGLGYELDAIRRTLREISGKLR